MSSDFTRQMLEQLLLPHFSKSDVQERIHAYAHPYRELIAYYRCAMMHVETKFNILDEELSLEYDRNPIESIKTRLKSLESIVDKAIRKQVPLTVESIELKQDDITLIEKKDYIANPKPNGYRSLHLIVETPIFLHDKKKMMKVEVQFRTISMDWWASLEHKIRYKKDVEITPEIAQELYDCAEMSAELDKRMETIQNTVFGDKEAMKNLT